MIDAVPKVLFNCRGIRFPAVAALFRAFRLKLSGPQIIGPYADPPVPDKDDDGYLVPPWIKYPNIPRESLGWRMGDGEVYLIRFGGWWRNQSDDSHQAFKAKYVEPEHWRGFLQ